MIYPWQYNHWSIFLKAYQQNRLSHAYLLSGVSGMGKTTFASHVAAFLLCENKQADFCNHCRSCQWIKSGTHPDFMLVVPEKNHTIKIDQIRELIHKTSQTAHASGYQIVIISPADAMPIQAANALLKTLEEPAGNVIFFLIDDQEHDLPTTILSRCQKISFLPDQMTAMTTWLNDTLPNEKNTAQLLRMANFAPLKVAEYASNHFLSLRDDVLHLFDTQSQKNPPIPSVTVFLKSPITLIFHLIFLLCVDFSRAQYAVDGSLMTNQDRQEKIKRVANRLSPVALQQFIAHVVEKKSMLAKGVPLNPQLCLEDIFIGWSQLP